MDATIIEAPSSTKNRNQERDPEMHQTKKGNQWHFGMKAHIGVDSDTGIVHSMSTTAANAHDVTETHHLLHGGERVMWGDVGYQGVHNREENLGLAVEWQVAMRPGRRRMLEPDSAVALVEQAKASVRAKVEHPFQRLKRQFGYWKVRYRGLAKNTERLALLFGLGNLLITADQLRGQCACRQYSSAFDPLTSSQLPGKGGEILEVNEIRPVREGESSPLPINQTQFRPRWALFRVSLDLEPVVLPPWDPTGSLAG